MKKHIAMVQVCWMIGAVCLLGGGLLALSSHNHKTLVDIATPLGIIMMFSGAVNVAIYGYKGKDIHGSHWLLADGMTAMLLAIYPLFNKMILPTTIPFFFGVWELFSGILKVIDSHELKEEKVRCWQGFYFLGFVELVSGAASMVKPIDEAMGYNVVVAVILFIQCAGFVLKSIMYHDLIDCN
jgi:uncharacterized membrane protein HdeD (DUF308 family)